MDLIRGLDVAAARLQLSVLPKRGAGIVLKVLNSAAANAEHNHQLKLDNLYVAKAFVDQGPTLKRFTAKAFGRGATIRKRTSHITLVLDDKAGKKDTRYKKQDKMIKEIKNERTKEPKNGKTVL